jgi:hypothetical protein
MTNATRPLLFGYVRVHLLMTRRELNGVKQRLAKFADDEGYTWPTSSSSRRTRCRLRSDRCRRSSEA